MKEEIAKIKDASPGIKHKEAFSKAGKSWSAKKKEKSSPKKSPKKQSPAKKKSPWDAVRKYVKSPAAKKKPAKKQSSPKKTSPPRTRARSKK